MRTEPTQQLPAKYLSRFLPAKFLRQILPQFFCRRKNYGIATIGLALSLFLHALIVMLLSYKSAPQTPLAEAPQIEVSLAEETAVLAKGRKTGDVSSKKNTGSPAADSRQGQKADSGFTGRLFRAHHLSSIKSAMSSTPGSDASDASTDGHGWSSAVRYGNEMGLEKTLATLPFFLALHKKIDASLVYPADFARHRLTGIVRIEALLSKDGRLVRFTSTTADDQVLQTYCLVYLTQILSRPLAAPLHLESDELAAVAFDFDFRVRMPDQAPTAMTEGAQKNRLAFGREATVDPWLNEKIREIFTHYIPPIIPIPGGVYVDFYLAYQWVQNMINGAPTESDARAARIEKLHENLKNALRSSGPPEA